MVFARSAALSVRTWLEKAHQRSLIEEANYQKVKALNEKLIAQLYGFINFLEEEGGATPGQSIKKRQKAEA